MQDTTDITKATNTKLLAKAYILKLRRNSSYINHSMNLSIFGFGLLTCFLNPYCLMGKLYRVLRKLKVNMEHIPQSMAKRFDNGAVTSWEYEMQNASLNVALISIRGRYPENGFTSNLKSDSIIHITEGSGLLKLRDGTIVELAENDQLRLAAGDEYCFEGELGIIYAASPPWAPEQTVHSN